MSLQSAADLAAAFQHLGAAAVSYTPVAGPPVLTRALLLHGVEVRAAASQLTERRTTAGLLLADVPSPQRGDTLIAPGRTWTIDATVSRDEHTVTVIVR